MKNMNAVPPLVPEQVDVVCQAGKLVTILALSTFTERPYPTFYGLSERINELQGPEPVVDFDHGKVRISCSVSLAHAKFVDFSQEQLGKRKIQTVRMSSRGWNEGMAAAGALSLLEHEAPEGAFLKRIMGIKTELKESPRPKVLQCLLERPHSAADIVRHTGINHRTIGDNIRSLAAGKVVSNVDKEDPANRYYRISDQPYRTRSDTGPITRALIAAAIELRDKQDRQASGAEILAKAQAQLPDVPAEEIHITFGSWVANSRKRSRFIVQTDDDGKKSTHRKSEVSITDQYRPYVKKFLEVRHLLTDTSSRGEDFRNDSKKRAEEIAKSPELIAALLASDASVPAQALSGYQSQPSQQPARHLVLLKSDSDSKGVLDSATPEVATPPPEPKEPEHQEALVQVKPEPEPESRPEPKPEPVPEPEQNQEPEQQELEPEPDPEKEPKIHVFTSDWADDAACLHEDPEIFFPPSIAGPSIRQAEEAREICQGCPVRLACLKFALDTGMKEGVQGGVWLDNPGEVTPELKAEIGATVRIVKARRVPHS